MENIRTSETLPIVISGGSGTIHDLSGILTLLSGPAGSSHSRIFGYLRPKGWNKNKLTQNNRKSEQVLSGGLS